MSMRDRREPHVRPRPPSDGRPHRRVIRPVAPSTERLGRYRPAYRNRSLPVPVQLVLVAVAICLASAMLLVGSGMGARAIGGIGSAFKSLISHVTTVGATPSPKVIALDTPLLIAPPNGGYTNKPSVPIQGTIPASVVGKNGYSVRIYRVILQDVAAPSDAAETPTAEPAQEASQAAPSEETAQGPSESPEATSGLRRLKVAEVAVGGTISFAVPSVPLTDGGNDFTATLAGPSGESGESPVIHFVLDATPPTIKITSPRANSLLSTATATVAGTSEVGATVAVRGDRASGGDTTTVGADGTFKLNAPLLPGSNVLTITATDRAGNVATAQLTLRRDSGRLAVGITVSPRRVSSKSQSTTITMTAHVTSSVGGPMGNVRATFVLNLPGVQTITSPEMRTDASGTVSWTTTVTGVTPGVGQAAVTVTTATDGTINQQTTITVT